MRVIARCRVLARAPDNAAITIGLWGAGPVGSWWHEVRAHRAFGQTPRASAWFANTYTARSVADAGSFALVLERRSGVLTGRHEGDDGEDIVRCDVDAQAMRLGLRLLVEGAARDAVVVELVGLEIQAI